MILPPATLGMLGGGQLARFFVIAAHEMGYKVVVLDPDKKSPAGLLADTHLCAAYDDVAALDEMARTCVAVTTEFENVPASTLDALAKSVPVHPAASAVAVCQHRVSEKNFLRDNGFPHAPYAEINAEGDIPAAESGMYPGILKVARFGYDGKGQARVSSPEEALAAFRSFKSEQCVLEKRLTLDYEVSVVLARDVKGNIQAFPTVENSHRHGILDVSIAPARAARKCANRRRHLRAALLENWAMWARWASSSLSATAASTSTKWRLGRTIPAITPSMLASPTSSSSKYVHYAACLWAIRACTALR